MSHIHPDPARLHFACPACRERAVQDQLDAEVAEATVYEVAVVLDTGTSFKVELPWPKSWPPNDVVAYYTQPKHRPVLQSAIDRHLSTSPWSIETVQVRSMRPGAPVPKPPPPDPMEGQPTLFG